MTENGEVPRRKRRSSLGKAAQPAKVDWWIVGRWLSRRIF